MFKKISVISAVLLIAAGLIIFPDSTSESAFEAITLCGRVIIPSLFPFLVLSSFVIKANVIGAVKNAGLNAFVLGVLGGYPVGASCVCEMYMQKKLTKDTSERLLAFCNNCGPAFIFGAVGGGIFKSLKVGIFLYTVHILSAIFTALIFYRRTQSPAASRISESGAFPNAIKSAMNSTLNICAFVIFFSVLCEILTDFNILPAICALLGGNRAIEACIIGALEMTSGIYRLTPARESIIFASAIIGFGGFSVHSQALTFISDAKLSPKKYFTGKILQSVFSIFLSSLGLLLNII